MWEAIASNRRRSLILITLMGVLLVLLGALIGATVAAWIAPLHHALPSYGSGQPWAVNLEERTGAPSLGDQVFAARGGALWGILVALVIWLILWATAAGAGDSILLGTARAREIQKEDAPQLWNVVEEMTIAAGLGQMPRVFLIDDSALNAFAVGYRPHKAAVAVTAGLLKRLTRDELQGVVAHELGHIRNLDVRFMTLAAVMVGAIALLAQFFLRGMFYSGSGRRSSSKGGGQAQLFLLLIAVLVAILAPLAAQLLYFACSRRREFLADASSARFTRYPEGLASALEKISGQAGAQAEISKVVAPLYIVNPLQEHAAFSLFSTHPKTIERITILRSMAGAGYAAYENAFRKIQGGQPCVGAITLTNDQGVPVRPPTPEVAKKEDAIARARAVGQLLDKVLPFVVIPCACGARLKLTPDFKRDTLQCPRCGREHAVPKAEAAGSATEAAPAKPLRYRRQGTGWESFQCACGHPVQLSPKFSGSHIECPKCRRDIVVVPAAGD
jgi:heat shock protein HtpX